MHGHLRNTGLAVKGALPAEAITPVTLETMLEFSAGAMSRIRLYSGTLILRFVIGAGGTVETCNVLVDRVIAHDLTSVGWEALAEDLVTRFRKLKFPSSSGRTEVTQPITFGAG